MKTHHYILLSTFLFLILFYEEKVGLNLGILGIIYSVLTFFKTNKSHRNSSFLVLFVLSICSSFAFAWYGDYASFLALVSCLLMLSYRSREKRMNIILLIPVFITNFATSLCRIFSFEKWIPRNQNSGSLKKMFAFFVFPLLLVLLFFGVYSAGSTHFAELFTNYELDINIWEAFCISVVGFFIAFNYFNFKVERQIYKQNYLFENDFKVDDYKEKSTFTFLDVHTERTSGVITITSLCVLLLFFIITFTIEQFYELPKSPNQLSDETHQRVTAVIVSIVMSIFVLLFYFKSYFNFDPKAQFLKLISKIWIVLNAILMIITFLKNIEYILNYGFTYKRLGVIAFIMVGMLGLIFTFIKIQNKKTNVYLFNAMVWCVFGTILVCSYVNWGCVITSQNSKRKDFAKNFHLQSIHFNQKELLEYAEKSKDEVFYQEVKQKIKEEKSVSFLSKILYFETIQK